LAETLTFVKYKDLYDKIYRIREVMREVFGEYNRMGLGFLKEADFEDTRRFFASLKPLGKANGYIFLQCLQAEIDEAEGEGAQTLVMSTESLRVGIRIGLIKKTGSHNVARKEYSKLIDPEDYAALQNYFVRHAEVYCRSKSPLCKDCFVNALCKYFDG
jgi:endonuclease III